MKTQILAVVSDLHCGSVVGLSPPETKTESGNVVGFGDNHHQAWLWDNWNSAAEHARAIIGKSPAALLINGDATEGHHHKNEADLIAATIETHTAMAADCLKPFLKLCKTRFVTAGTECHTRNMETVLAGKINAVDNLARDKWHIRIHDCLIDAAHHMSVTGRAYLEASAMSILMGNARLNYLRTGAPVPSVFLRAHRHCGGVFEDGAGLWGVTGAWQFLTRHGYKVVPDSIPRPSILILDWRGKKPGALPVPHHIFFNPPHAQIKKI